MKRFGISGRHQWPPENFSHILRHHWYCDMQEIIVVVVLLKVVISIVFIMCYIILHFLKKNCLIQHVKIAICFGSSAESIYS